MILRIVSPEKVIYKGEVQMVKLPGTVGSPDYGCGEPGKQYQ